MKERSLSATLQSLPLLAACLLLVHGCVLDERPFPGDTNGGASGGCTAECCADADCPAPSNECERAICADATCGGESLPANTHTPTQTEGDCQVRVCDGSGAAVVQSDDTDVHDDKNGCTVDTCVNGSPKSTPEPVGAACQEKGGKVCDGAGKCVVCNVDADCTTAPLLVCDQTSRKCVTDACMDGVEDGDETDIDCGGSCKGCDTGETCGDGGDCYNKVCDNGTCAAPGCGDGAQNGGGYMMNDGETDVDCGGPCGPTCGPDQKCGKDEDCVDQKCDSQSGTCVSGCFDAAKDHAETDVDCGGPVAECPTRCAIGSACGADDSNCESSFCLVGLCQAKLPLAIACTKDSHCESGHCVDGVCCESACTGLCQACNLALAAGSCAPIPAGQDPANECAGSQVCNGWSSCRKSQGDSCGAGTDCLSGSCADGFCCDTSCNAPCMACSAQKTLALDGTCAAVIVNTDPDGECVGATACNGFGGCAKVFTGASCNQDTECITGHCADSVCCLTDCTGTCKTCLGANQLVGLDGLCGYTKSGIDPDVECSSGQTCNGIGGCQ